LKSEFVTRTSARAAHAAGVGEDDARARAWDRGPPCAESSISSCALWASCSISRVKRASSSRCDPEGSDRVVSEAVETLEGCSRVPVVVSGDGDTLPIARASIRSS
jgi:hypothetical protein